MQLEGEGSLASPESGWGGLREGALGRSLIGASTPSSRID